MGKARFIVYNKSNSKIDSLYFMPSNIKTRHFLSLKPGEEVRYKLSMDEQGSDGAYGIMFKQRDKFTLCKFQPIGNEYQFLSLLESP
jgi:hypothetical protein